jgi:hypothetical protein
MIKFNFIFITVIAIIVFTSISGCQENSAIKTNSTLKSTIPTLLNENDTIIKTIHVIDKQSIIVSFPNSNGPPATAIAGYRVNVSGGDRYGLRSNQTDLFNKLENGKDYPVIIDNKTGFIINIIE